MRGDAEIMQEIRGVMVDQVIRLTGERQRENLAKIVQNLPVDGSIECVIRTFEKIRSQGQNARQWAAVYADMAAQAWVGGKKHSAEVWHEHCKRAFLPEADDPRLHKLVNEPERWSKWRELPNGDLICVGSTTKLTRLGMSEYQTQVEAWAAQELGVMFTVARHG